MTDLFHDPEPELSDDHHEESRSSRSRSHRRREKKRAAQRRRTLVSFVVMSVALALVVGAGWIFLRPLLSGLGGGASADPSVIDYPGPGSGSAEVVVNPGDSGAAIGGTLVDADVVATVDAFVAAYNANADAASIQPGNYTLTQQIPATEAVAALLDPASRSDAAITVPEGWRASQIYARLAETLEVDVADVEAAAEDLDLPTEAEGEVEGWLFPSTYTIATDATAGEVMQQMVDTTVQVLEDNDVPQADWHEVIIKASIVEKEVSREEDRPLVAEVIDNRLDFCNDSGRLEMDSTLVYELGKPASEITSSEWAADTPYNTRVLVGLPPTAISSPGESAIQAAANPAQGDYCYFVTVNLDTGETKFTADYDEFLEFKDEYQQWREDNG